MLNPVRGVAVSLLLVCFGLVCSAQDCPRPVPGPHMDLKEGDIELSNFPDGIRVTFACQSGYVSAGGSAVITCNGGTWSPLRLRCEKRNCGAFEEVENGELHYPTGTEFGDSVVITCKSGFQIVGKKEIYCGAQGWMGRAPVCEVVSCLSPPTIQNGAFRPIKDSYDYGEVVEYTCQEGLTLNGSAQISCSEDGKFQPHPPNCTRVECKDPDIRHADYVQGSRPPHGYKATVTYRCRTGYKMVGSPTVTCGINSEWSPKLPQCTVVTCNPPRSIANGAFDPNKDSYNYGEVVHYSCVSNFNLVGKSSVSCSDRGTFDSDPPTCVMVTCNPPRTIANGAFDPNKDSYNYGEVVHFRCNPNFNLVGAKNVSCTNKGIFYPDPPACIRVDTPSTMPPPAKECELPHIKHSVRVDNSVPPFRINAKVKYMCQDGYKMEGEPELTCGPDFEWIPDPPKCHGDGLTPGGIAGITFGVIGLLCIIGGIYVYHKKKRKSHITNEAHLPHEEEEMNPRGCGGQELTPVENGKK